MRVVRPLTKPNKDYLEKVWEADIEQIREDSTNRIDENGRGARGVASPELLPAIEKMQKRK